LSASPTQPRRSDGILCDTDELTSHDFIKSIQKTTHNVSDFSITNTNGAPRPLADIERDALQHALQHYGGNVTQAAISLGLAKSTFYRKLKEYELAS
jgi:transcriptional regulator of acetoin/glycerol metabolism